ncbi:MAG: SurA N-terminal domain-containing protein, partial [Pseudomonadales bacterium]|nr:SurA N-terminal domain-containing protein [Pseudomonadales bacterium]
MQQFRNLLKGWVGKVLLFIFILPFAFFGIEGIFNSGSKQDVAIEVNGVEISKMEVSRAIQNQRNNLKAQMGGNIDDSFFSDEMLAPGVIENLIQRELLKQALQNDGLTVAPDLVKSYVRSMPQFQDEQGNFSNERLEIALVQANYTKLKLYSVVQESMVMEQLQAGVGASAFITDSELERLAKLNGQTRDASYAKFEVAPLKETIELTEEEKQAYYEENKAQYRTEEKIKLEYVALSRDDFKGEIEVTEDELNSAYDDYVAG